MAPTCAESTRNSARLGVESHLTEQQAALPDSTKAADAESRKPAYSICMVVHLDAPLTLPASVRVVAGKRDAAENALGALVKGLPALLEKRRWQGADTSDRCCTFLLAGFGLDWRALRRKMVSDTHVVLISDRIPLEILHPEPEPLPISVVRSDALSPEVLERALIQGCNTHQVSRTLLKRAWTSPQSTLRPTQDIPCWFYLSLGYDTKSISSTLHFSERTVNRIIQRLRSVLTPDHAPESGKLRLAAEYRNRVFDYKEDWRLDPEAQPYTARIDLSTFS